MAQQNEAEIPNFRPKLIGIGAVVAAIAISGMFLVASFARVDYQRDLRNWQDKLNLIADSRAAEVGKYIDDHFLELKKLASNPSLQLYFTELEAMNAPPAAAGEEATNPPQEPAQKSYLRNLLIFTADRMGFAPATLPASLQIPTQIPFETGNGLAVLDNENRVAVSTPFLTSLSQAMATRVAQVPQGMQMLLDMQKDTHGKPAIGFVVPVFPIQADPDASQQSGRVVGIKQVGDSLFNLLKHPGATEKTLEVALVREEGGNIVYLSPMGDGSLPLEKQLLSKPDSLAEAYALASHGGFALRKDYASNDVLVTGRAIPGTPWTLVVKINKQEAFAGSELRRNGMIALLLVIVALIVAVVAAVWYVATSRRAMLMSGHFRNLAEKTMAQERLLSLVTENQQESLALLDDKKRYCMVNRLCAEEAGMKPQDMLGKTVADVLGAARAEDINEAAASALEQGVEQERVLRRHGESGERIIRHQVIPLKEIPVPGAGGKTPGVLVVEQDISEVVREREARIRAHRQLINALVKLVDRRDPHAANHSLLVSQIAQELAGTLELNAESRETARVAGLLMNIGKIVVPEHVLTKREGLSENERRNIRESLNHSAELLKDIAFDGPVVETLQQSQEHWDGTGPQGLRGEAILLPARIIAVVNAFVGMISPRSWRAAIPIDKAASLLLDEAGTQFDRSVAIALVNFVENKGGKQMLQHWLQNRGAA